MNCIHCNKLIETGDGRNKFCNKSCAAIFNNKIAPKRKKTKKCRHCEALIESKLTFCHSCAKQGRHLKSGKPLGERTLGEELDRRGNKINDANRYCNIRKHAHTCSKQLKRVCAYCGYDKHVEFAHKKAISDFPNEAKIKEINSLDNLIFLCPNHHWEFDNNVIEVVAPQGFKP